MADQQSDIEEKIEKHRLDILYRRSKTASLTLLVISAIYISVLLKKFEWNAPSGVVWRSRHCRSHANTVCPVVLS